MNSLSSKKAGSSFPMGVKIVDQVTAAKMLGVRNSRIKQLISDNVLVGAWNKGTWWIPMLALVKLDSDLGRQTWAVKELKDVSTDRENGENMTEATHVPLRPLCGTVTLLEDGGFTMAETCEWLFAENEALGEWPIDAIRGGHRHRVNQIAGALAW